MKELKRTNYIRRYDKAYFSYLKKIFFRFVDLLLILKLIISNLFSNCSYNSYNSFEHLILTFGNVKIERMYVECMAVFVEAVMYVNYAIFVFHPHGNCVEH